MLEEEGKRALAALVAHVTSHNSETIGDIVVSGVFMYDPDLNSRMVHHRLAVMCVDAETHRWYGWMCICPNTAMAYVIELLPTGAVVQCRCPMTMSSDLATIIGMRRSALPENDVLATLAKHLCPGVALPEICAHMHQRSTIGNIAAWHCPELNEVIAPLRIAISHLPHVGSQWLGFASEGEYAQIRTYLIIQETPTPYRVQDFATNGPVANPALLDLLVD